ncbi:hypothetical protein V4V36_19085 [Paenibacillus lautus]|uniref:hypothetical protein n=1 Tax=Bacillales TaxID=1385 RepID=UPI0001788121|nr:MULTISPECIES: hypothetical protein [Paenibacillus]MBY0165048.1 hypothetical protein [Cytobacillus firmus]VTR22998.1 Uncharacterised protein [Actinobacillus pleuropneumoniae]ACX67902.1 hypothetical protein GYMC10_5695 [Paenibacillus sp. Y412MC10]EGG38381.1 conserved domain protein [Paenibacillus sp. HGF5]ETT61586.1 hypothetical protein C172_19006 [Paenibacillus sp. FSL H8-457]
MITYGCLGILFLFVIIKITAYSKRKKNAPTPEQLQQTLLEAANSKREQHG